MWLGKGEFVGEFFVEEFLSSVNYGIGFISSYCYGNGFVRKWFVRLIILEMLYIDLGVGVWGFMDMFFFRVFIVFGFGV